jgi:hypothetical protein
VIEVEERNNAIVTWRMKDDDDKRRSSDGKKLGTIGPH